MDLLKTQNMSNEKEENLHLDLNTETILVNSFKESLKDVSTSSKVAFDETDNLFNSPIESSSSIPFSFSSTVLLSSFDGKSSTSINGLLIGTYNSLDHTQPSFPAMFSESPKLLSTLQTPSMDNFHTISKPYYESISALGKSDTLDLLESADLVAEGAEYRHSIVASPATHYTTYTYYTTVLKPGGKRVIDTSTKVVAATYDQSPATHALYQDGDRNVNRRNLYRQNNYDAKPPSKCCGDSRTIRPTKRYELIPERAVPHTYSVHPNRQHNEPYRPSFATKVRGPFYHTDTGHANVYHQNTEEKSQIEYRILFFNTIPIPTQRQKVPNRVPNTVYQYDPIPTQRQKAPVRVPNTVYQQDPAIKPTRVTYFSTYTYFTTELMDGSPTVRSREHTVTEILTDVVLPTVTSLHNQAATRSPTYRRVNNDWDAKLHSSRISDKRESFLFKETVSTVDLDKDYYTDFSGDLTLNAAEVLYKTIRATPVTHYTTNTYYTTILKPGNRREVQTNTKLVSSIYYPDIQATTTYSGRSTTVPRNYRQPKYQEICNTCRNRQESTRYQKPYYINPKQSENKKPGYNLHNRNLKPTNRQNVVKFSPSVQPSLVTFYSTYTYFTTELGGPTPIVRSREHTVTEILSDVIVPTVLKSRPKRSEIPIVITTTDSPSFATLSPKFGFRKLLALDDLDDSVGSFTRETEEEVKPLVKDLQSIYHNRDEESLNKNILVSSPIFNDIPSSVEFHNFTKDTEESNDDFLSDSQFSKAYAAYLEFLKSAEPQPLSSDGDIVKKVESSPTKEESYSKTPKSSKYIVPKFTATVSVPVSKSDTKNMISTLTSNATRNGRMTKYTTTIYGTYINGVYAQRAESNSEIIL
ncbi:uncharacterized protein CEXT_175941 [Caerostris extrusa]|uniref:DUF4758 domain-containing protein n=1 Tax=Caerostris extrusa TaxID=172846 RepID=A0AAV4NMK3_CAEEX|nr:uncharacterized protein CEXT_175941 [Caerostris extrusa]